MAYDEGLAQRLREHFADRRGLAEKKMFGGLAFMFRGHMLIGISGEVLMARVGPEQYDSALNHPHARAMDFTGKPMKGFVYVDPPVSRPMRSWKNGSSSVLRSTPACRGNETHLRPSRKFPRVQRMIRQFGHSVVGFALRLLRLRRSPDSGGQAVSKRN